MLITSFKVRNATKYVYRCDSTLHEYEHWFCNRKLRKSKTHNCSVACLYHEQKKGGKVERVLRDTNLEKFGHEYAWQVEEIKQKAFETNMKNLGVKTPGQSPIVQEKIKATNLERYGVVNPFNSEFFQQQARETRKNLYGFEHALQAPQFRKKMQQTNFKNFGVAYAQQSAIIKNKIKTTNEKRYGHACTLWSTEVKQAINSRGLPCRTSAIENELKSYLDTMYDEVHCQAPIQKWFIDFYIPQYDFYIQFDGAYWHGYGKTIEELQKSGTTRDLHIMNTKLNDEQQNAYFKTVNKKLFRVLENDFNLWKKNKSVIESLIEFFHGKTEKE